MLVGQQLVDFALADVLVLIPQVGGFAVIQRAQREIGVSKTAGANIPVLMDVQGFEGLHARLCWRRDAGRQAKIFDCANRALHFSGSGRADTLDTQSGVLELRNWDGSVVGASVLGNYLVVAHFIQITVAGNRHSFELSGIEINAVSSRCGLCRAYDRGIDIGPIKGDMAV